MVLLVFSLPIDQEYQFLLIEFFDSSQKKQLNLSHHVIYHQILLANINSRLELTIVLKLLMLKQRSKPINHCFCQEFLADQTRLKGQLIERMDVEVDQGRYSLTRLLHMHFAQTQIKEGLLTQIDTTLRTYLRQDSTLEYSQDLGMLDMIDILINRVKKQRDVHYVATKKQDLAIERYESKLRAANKQISYLKELLNEEQIDADNWKKEVKRLEALLSNLNQQLIAIKYNGITMEQLRLQHLEDIDKLKLEFKFLEDDKNELSLQWFQKTEEITKLSEELQSTKQSLKYQAKIQFMEQLSTLALREDSQHFINKEQMVEFLQSAGKAGTPFRIVRADAHLSQSTAKQDNLNRTNASITNPQNSRMYTEKSYSPELPRQSNKDNTLSHLFTGDVLVDQNEKRYYLVSLMQQMMTQLIGRTRLLYRWDKFNNTSIHRYIDGHPHIVVLIRTQNQHCLAAYSQAAYKLNVLSNQIGYLISLREQITFKNTKKAIIYDQNEVIFGNYDLKVRSGDSKITSNFGSIGSFYENKGYGVDALLGQGKSRQARIKYMQIFQLVFQS